MEDRQTFKLLLISDFELTRSARTGEEAELEHGGTSRTTFPVSVRLLESRLLPLPVSSSALCYPVARCLPDCGSEYLRQYSE